MKALLYSICVVLMLIVALQAAQIHTLNKNVQKSNEACRKAQDMLSESLKEWDACQQWNEKLKEENIGISKIDRLLLDVMHDHKKVCPVW